MARQSHQPLPQTSRRHSSEEYSSNESSDNEFSNEPADDYASDSVSECPNDVADFDEESNEDSDEESDEESNEESKEEPNEKSKEESNDASKEESQEETDNGPPSSIEIPRSISIVTAAEVLTAGLTYAGFNAQRQQRVSIKRNVKRFKAHFGVGHTTVTPLLIDVMNKYGNTHLKDCLMTMNWLKLGDSLEVLSGRWKQCEEYIGPKVKECAKKMQSLKEKKIKFTLNDDKHIFSGAVDCCTFLAQEFRLNPSAKNFDPKSHSCGLVSSICCE